VAHYWNITVIVQSGSYRHWACALVLTA